MKKKVESVYLILMIQIIIKCHHNKNIDIIQIVISKV